MLLARTAMCVIGNMNWPVVIEAAPEEGRSSDAGVEWDGGGVGAVHNLKIEYE